MTMGVIMKLKKILNEGNLTLFLLIAKGKVIPVL